MNAPEESSLFQTVVTTLYRRVVAEAGPDGIQRQDAIDAATAELLAMHERGQLEVPVAEAIRAALSRADETDGRLADRVIRAAARGEVALSVDGDPILDVVVVLGSGLRKPWRDVRAADLMAMDTERYRNVRNVQDGYSRWRDTYDVLLPAVIQHGTFGELIAAGALASAA